MDYIEKWPLMVIFNIIYTFLGSIFVIMNRVIVYCIDKEQMPGWDFCTFEDTFLLGVTQFVLTAGKKHANIFTLSCFSLNTVFDCTMLGIYYGLYQLLVLWQVFWLCLQ